MQPHLPFVTPIHSMFKYVGARRYNDPYSKQILGAVGDRDGHDDPHFVTITEEQLKWRNLKMISAAAEENDMEPFYRSVENRRLFFRVEDTHFAEGEVRAWVPQMPALPAELAL
jgi:hypothetical protein